MKCVLIFSATFVCNTSHSKYEFARCDHKLILVFKQGTLYSSQTSMKPEFSRHFSKNTQI
jgi:hypothetical protein